MADTCCQIEGVNRAERRVLWVLLSINFFMFLGEAWAGWFADSSALVADSLDMLADAGVYGLSLYAVGRAPADKYRAAFASGGFQSLLALFVGFDVLHRFVSGSDPVSGWMTGVAALALAANVICMLLLARHRHGEVHMRASWTCSTNDVLANLSVLAAGGLVYLTGSRLPDLLIGLVIAAIVLRRAVKILRDAWKGTGPDASVQPGSPMSEEKGSGPFSWGS